MSLPMGRRPFPVNIDRRIPVATMGCSTDAGPDTLTERAVFVESAADMTQFGRGKEPAEVIDVCPRLLRRVAQPRIETKLAKPDPTLYAPIWPSCHAGRSLPGRSCRTEYTAPVPCPNARPCAGSQWYGGHVPTFGRARRRCCEPCLFRDKVLWARWRNEVFSGCGAVTSLPSLPIRNCTK